MSTDVEKDWTIMVYMAGDNNLSENMAYSLADLAEGFGAPDPGVKDRVNLCAFFDGSSLTAPTKYIDFSQRDDNNNPVEQLPDSGKPFEYELADDVDSATATSILNFVKWCIEKQNRRAKNYALIFSGHSFAFDGTSMLRDESSGSYITLFRFRWALEQLTRRYLKQEIAILGFDSCVMSMLEVAYQLKGTALTMVASEGSLPNSGWSYAPLLEGFFATFNPQPPPEKAGIDFVKTPEYVRLAATSFVDSFIRHHNGLLIGGRSVDISAWDLEPVLIDDVVASVNNFARALTSTLDLTDRVQNGGVSNEEIRCFHELKKAILQSRYDSQSYMKNQAVDLVDFCERFMIECEFLKAGPDGATFVTLHKYAQSVIDSVRACVLLSGYSGDEYQFSNGISIYFPWSLLTFSLTNYRYRHLHFVRGATGRSDAQLPNGPGGGWYIFLRTYLSRVTLRLVRSGNASELPQTAESSWSSGSPGWTKDNPRWDRDNPPLNRDNPRLDRDNPRLDRGQVGEYLFYFERFRNVQMSWNIHGFTKRKPKDSGE